MDALGILREVSRRNGVRGRVVEAMTAAAELIGEEGGVLDQRIIDACTGAPAGVEQACRHILEAGGKRIRPSLCLLAFRAVNGAGALPLDLAVSCELLHNATLLHDDVIDDGQIRRGRPAARMVYGNAISILGGDFLLVRTVDLVSRAGEGFMAPLIETLHRLVEGEVTQLRLRGSTETTREEYFRIIEGKTASLFRWAARAGSMAGGTDGDTCEQLAVFGWHVGIAFQLMDDVLDLTADPAAIGKGLLADIGEGKMTLPVIIAAQDSAELQELLQRLAAGEDPTSLAPRIAEIVQGSGAVAEARLLAADHTDKALGALSEASGLDTDTVRVLDDLSRALLEREI